MKVSEFEDKVWRVESIRIIVRASADQEVGEYNYNNAADATWRINELIEKRISPCLGDITCSVIQGNGEEPHGRVILRTLREGYAH